MKGCFVNPRLKRLTAQFPQQEIDSYLVTNDSNVTYLTEVPSKSSWLLVCPQKTYYLTDARYAGEVRGRLKGISVRLVKDSRIATFCDLMAELKFLRVGFDSRHMSLDVFKKIRGKVKKSVALVARNGCVENLREIKEESEIRLIEKALAIHQRMLAHLQHQLKPGMTERMVLLSLQSFIVSHNVTFSFDPIIASGPQSSYPHARVTDRKIRRDEPLLVDAGIDISGYKSDLTHMFFLGKIPPLVREIRDIVADAQKMAINMIRPGVSACDVDRQARNHFKKNKLEKYFLHSLGHGVGLDIHEAPWISSKSTAKLKEGMIFTVEPAVYLPRKFGIRIEDMVLVTRQGCRLLS